MPHEGLGTLHPGAVLRDGGRRGASRQDGSGGRGLGRVSPAGGLRRWADSGDDRLRTGARGCGAHLIRAGAARAGRGRAWAGSCTPRARPEAPRKLGGASLQGRGLLSGASTCPELPALRPSLPAETRAGPRPTGVSPPTPLQLPGASTLGSWGREPLSADTLELSVTQAVVGW